MAVRLEESYSVPGSPPVGEVGGAAAELRSRGEWGRDGDTSTGDLLQVDRER